ncbi:MAG: hypothetical protein ABI150_06445 [Nitrobacter sp.]|jgi:hypothetical protein
MKPSPQIKHYTSQKKYQEYIFKTFVPLVRHPQQPLTLRAEVLSSVAGNVGAVAFCHTEVDPTIGEFSDAVGLKSFGEVPDDLNPVLIPLRAIRARKRPL